jgi:anti-sigma factor RsiW
MRPPEHTACPKAELAAYVDGEIDAPLQLKIELHAEQCADCAEELELYKKIAGGLEATLPTENEIDVPADFAKRVAVHAQSAVVGAGDTSERTNALLIASTLLFVTVLTMAADASQSFNGASAIAERAFAVGSFIAHLVYSGLLGITVVLRSMASHLEVTNSPAASVIAVSIVIFAVALWRSRRSVRA